MFTASYLEHLGVRRACISPGARNSPLTAAFTNIAGVECSSHIDERGAAFFALGVAKSTQRPVVLICTSGTAAANYFPAVIEAEMSRTPLIILTADRPGFLIGTGANQTINQQNLYGNHVRFFRDVGLPISDFSTLNFILRDAWIYALGSYRMKPPGPVHLNFPFDEPLLPDNLDDCPDIELSKENINLPDPKSKEIPKLAFKGNTLIVHGPMEGNHHQNKIIDLAEKLHAPIFADPLSQLRYGFDCPLILSHYDFFMRSNEVTPDLVLRFGRKPTSKKLNQYLDKWKDKTILIDAWEQFNDDCPQFIQAPIGDFCDVQMDAIITRNEEQWTTNMLQLEKSTNAVIANNKNIHEGIIAKTCLETLKNGNNFIIGNSMPIRDVDSYSSAVTHKISAYSNRGTSGIDGVISTAMGVAQSSPKSHSLLLIGDVSFFHDLNAFQGKSEELHLTVVVVNNAGGGIFSFLPIAKTGIDQFSTYWTTNPKAEIQKAAELFGIPYYSAVNHLELKTRIQTCSSNSNISIIEVKTDIDENIHQHNKTAEEVEKALAEF
ncbi:MAG: 2-succinyl-5-enolpyruvyl-6-hydroxy-3-cyclohexene-1-carboxylic-acid synthase [Candidatus Marinimicrobia bacterium]|nr:2-succinyl-5-enolpyruvyl-6-hydroxy-3-cyclohexene-1-carboxylic-acid synthase [Candidatus Neomarinimicrobiota bacterium]